VKVTPENAARCDQCAGRGWYCETTNPDEPNPFNLEWKEAYCSCEAGARRKQRDEVKP
jgi:hypothetical protein